MKRPSRYRPSDVTYGEWERCSPAQRKFYNCGLDIALALPLTRAMRDDQGVVPGAKEPNAPVTVTAA